MAGALARCKFYGAVPRRSKIASKEKERRNTLNIKHSNSGSPSQRRDTEKRCGNSIARQRMERRLQRENILRLLREQGLLLDTCLAGAA